MSVFFSSFEINDMHVQMIFYRSWKATCFSELLLWIVYKDLTVYSQFVGLSRGERVADNKEGVTLKAPFNTASATFRRPQIGTFCSCFYTQKSC